MAELRWQGTVVTPPVATVPVGVPGSSAAPARRALLLALNSLIGAASTMNAAALRKERRIQAWEGEGGSLGLRTPAEAATRPWILSTSQRDVRTPLAAFGSAAASGSDAERKRTTSYPKFKNDGGAREIRIGAREFECIGEAPPHDHPHVHIDMGSQDTILCPYCGTRYRMDPGLSPMQAEPMDSLFTEHNNAVPREIERPTAGRNDERADSQDMARSLQLRRRHADRSRKAARSWQAALQGEPSMFGYQGGEDETTVARKRGYLKDAQIKWPFLTTLDASTIRSEGQLVDLVKTRISLSQEQAAHDVHAWMEGKQF